MPRWRGWSGRTSAFVLPYTVLMLRGTVPRPRRPATSPPAWSLGGSPARTFWRVRLPLLRRPIWVALAVGFSVSVAQYLPTVFAGAGRYPTLTTEALALATGGDRRLAAVAALLLALLPLLALAAALAVRSPRLGHRQPDRHRLLALQPLQEPAGQAAPDRVALGRVLDVVDQVRVVVDLDHEHPALVGLDVDAV